MCIFFGSRSTIRCLGRSRRLGLDPLPTGDPLSYELDTGQPGMCKGLAKSSPGLPGGLLLAENNDDDGEDDHFGQQ